MKKPPAEKPTVQPDPDRHDEKPHEQEPTAVPGAFANPPTPIAINDDAMGAGAKAH